MSNLENKHLFDVATAQYAKSLAAAGRPYALYGAGQRARNIIALLTEDEQPALIVDDNPPADFPIEVLPLNALAEKQIDDVILASDVHQPSMFNNISSVLSWISPATRVETTDKDLWAFSSSYFTDLLELWKEIKRSSPKPILAGDAFSISTFVQKMRSYGIELPSLCIYTDQYPSGLNPSESRIIKRGEELNAISGVLALCMDEETQSLIGEYRIPSICAKDEYIEVALARRQTEGIRRKIAQAQCQADLNISLKDLSPYFRVIDYLSHKSQDVKYAIYGAGKWTTGLIDLLKKNKITLPVFIFDDNPEIKETASIPVKQSEGLSLEGIEYVIVGSRKYFYEMKHRLTDTLFGPELREDANERPLLLAYKRNNIETLSLSDKLGKEFSGLFYRIFKLKNAFLANYQNSGISNILVPADIRSNNWRYANMNYCGETCLLSGQWQSLHNYLVGNIGHMLYENIPQILITRELNLDCGYILPPAGHPGNRIAMELLDIFGVPESKIFNCPSGKNLLVETLYAYSGSPECGYENVTVDRKFIQWLRKSMENLIGQQNCPEKRRIYLTRGEGGKCGRRVINGKALEDVLKKHGFETVVFRALTFQEKIELSMNAECIITPWGATLFSAFFMPPGATIIRLNPPGPTDQCDFYIFITRVFGINYYEVPAAGYAPGMSNNLRDINFQVNIDYLDKLLCQAFSPENGKHG